MSKAPWKYMENENKSAFSPRSYNTSKKNLLYPLNADGIHYLTIRASFSYCLFTFSYCNNNIFFYKKKSHHFIPVNRYPLLYAVYIKPGERHPVISVLVVYIVLYIPCKLYVILY